jgi:hypothetical protein
VAQQPPRALRVHRQCGTRDPTALEPGPGRFELTAPALDPDTGRVTPIDPVTGRPISPDGGTRLDLDPATGLPLNPDTGRPFPIDPDTGLPFNPVTGLPVNVDPDTGRVTPIDPVTGLPSTPLPPNFTPADPGAPIDFPGQGHNVPINPVTGEPAEINPVTGFPYPINPETGQANTTPYHPDEDSAAGYPPRTQSDSPPAPNYASIGHPGSAMSAGGAQVQAGGPETPATVGPGLPPGMMGGQPMMPPMMPPPMGGMGGGGGDNKSERNRSTWLSEEEKVWGTDKTRGKTVLGKPTPGEQKGTNRHELIDAGPDGSRTGTSSNDDAGTRGRKRKPGIGNRRGNRQEQTGDSDSQRDRPTD